MPVDPLSLQRARSETLLGLADALSGLATRMRTQESASRDFARLVVRADRIASQAYLLHTSTCLFEENAKALAAELASFHASVVEAAARAKAETTRNTAAADALTLQARRITQVATVAVPVGSGTLRTELQPLETTLTALQGRIEPASIVIRDADALAARAAGLADGALRLLEGGNTTGATAMSIHQELRGFVGDAGSISKRMSGVLAGLGEAADQMAVCTREMSGSRLPTPRTEDVVWHSF